MKNRHFLVKYLHEHLFPILSEISQGFSWNDFEFIGRGRSTLQAIITAFGMMMMIVVCMVGVGSNASIVSKSRQNHFSLIW